MVGYTGCGKTELAKVIARGSKARLIVWDSKAELRFPGAGPSRGIGKLEKALRSGSRVVHWIPITGDRDELEDASMLVWRTPGPWLWWLDEAAECSAPNWIPRGIKLASQQGRSTKRSVLALTQRVAETHPVLRSQAEHIFVFADRPIDVDCKALAGHIGMNAGELEELLRELGESHSRHAHLWYVRPTQELRRCAPIPLGHGGARPPAPRQAATTE